LAVGLLLGRTFGVWRRFAVGQLLHLELDLTVMASLSAGSRLWQPAESDLLYFPVYEGAWLGKLEPSVQGAAVSAERSEPT
jgi:hypothetical protein